MTTLPFDINTVLLTGTIVSIIAYAVGMLLKGSGNAQKESNTILRNLVNDQKTEILSLRQRMHDMENMMTAVKLQIQTLKDRRDYLESLVKLALLDHFAKDPRVAESVKSTLAEVVKDS